MLKTKKKDGNAFRRDVFVIAVFKTSRVRRENSNKKEKRVESLSLKMPVFPLARLIRSQLSRHPRSFSSSAREDRRRREGMP